MVEGKRCFLCMCKPAGKWMHQEDMERNIYINIYIYQQRKDCKFHTTLPRIRTLRWSVSAWPTFNSPSSLLVDYYTAAEQTWPNENSDDLLVSCSPATENSSLIVALLLLCQSATLSLNDKHTVLFWVIRKTARVSRKWQSARSGTQIIHSK